MARSTQGGTRGFIRGKVGDSLYQVTRNSEGKPIQLVRAVEDGRTNPNTEGQAIARMQMALLMGTLAQFKQIVDHSFEGVPYGQLSIAEFVRVNMPLVQEDTRSHWEAWNVFGYPEKGVSVMRVGAFIMARGTLVIPTAVTMVQPEYSDGAPSIEITLERNNATVGELKQALGLNVDDYMTVLAMYPCEDEQNSLLAFCRYYLSSNVSDDTVISNQNVSLLFRTEGNTTPSITYANRKITLSFVAPVTAGLHSRYFVGSCLIFSRWDGQKWMRNTSQMVIPEYATGDADFAFKAPDEVFSTWYQDYNGITPNI